MYRSILVHLDHSKHCPARIDLACRLALDFDAHLIGLYAVDGREIAGDSATASAMMERMGLVATQAARYMAIFEERAARAGVAKREMREAQGDAARNVAAHARYCDLVVLGQGDPDEALTGVTPVFPQHVALAAGAPVLILPYYTDSFASIGQRALIAWDGGREAARAVRDALPFLMRAQQAFALSVRSKSSEPGEFSLSTDLAAYLARHGVRVEASETFAGADIGVGDALLARVSDHGADLVVMGAYGHSRLRELVLGGVTQTLLGHMTAPVLLSH
jgi:nucleotide-binding universal stress UspA family protein